MRSNDVSFGSHPAWDLVKSPAAEPTGGLEQVTSYMAGVPNRNAQPAAARNTERVSSPESRGKDLRLAALWKRRGGKYRAYFPTDYNFRRTKSEQKLESAPETMLSDAPDDYVMVSSPDLHEAPKRPSAMRMSSHEWLKQPEFQNVVLCNGDGWNERSMEESINERSMEESIGAEEFGLRFMKSGVILGRAGDSSGHSSDTEAPSPKRDSFERI